jgi:hypothetical protein
VQVLLSALRFFNGNADADAPCGWEMRLRMLNRASETSNRIRTRIPTDSARGLWWLIENEHTDRLKVQGYWTGKRVSLNCCFVSRCRWPILPLTGFATATAVIQVEWESVVVWAMAPQRTTAVRRVVVPIGILYLVRMSEMVVMPAGTRPGVDFCSNASVLARRHTADTGELMGCTGQLPVSLTHMLGLH